MPCNLLLDSCVALSFYKSLSSEIIHYIFSVDFLDQLEEEIASDSESVSKYHDYVKNRLMNLNRIVCLDNPEEKIPWFHEKYCRDQCEIRPPVISSFHKDVSEILALILGNKNLICFNTQSPYYYNIDIEFALSEGGTPVSPFEQTKRKQNERNLFKTDNYQEPYKRVAVQLRRSSCYSSNNQALVGSCQIQRKHLEMLGYAVVDVPEHVWYSMSYAKQADKYKLLKSLIYKELLKVS